MGMLHYIAAVQGAMGSGNPLMHYHFAQAIGSRSPAIHCLGAIKSGLWISFCTPQHCRGQGAVGILQYAALQRLCVWGGGAENSSVHCHIDGCSGHWISFSTPLHYKALQGQEQLESFCTLPHHKRQWAMEMLQSTTKLYWAVGSGNSSVVWHCTT